MCIARICLRSLVLVLAALAPHAVLAAPPTEAVLPNTTTGFFSTYDLDRLEANFDATQLGILTQQPEMAPFIKDLKGQIKNKWGKALKRLGLSIDDMRAVSGGEATIAVMQPVKGTANVAVLAEITGHAKESAELLAKIDGNMKEQKATRKDYPYKYKDEDKDKEVQVVHYELPRESGQAKADETVLFIRDDMLVAVDSLALAAKMLKRFGADAADSLASLPAFSYAMNRAASQARDLEPDVRWFVEPFGYTETMRLLNGPTEKKRGQDMLKILREQGFSAIKGVGGYVNFHVGRRLDIVHRTAIHAPAVPGVPPQEKYELAARMLQLPNGGDLHPQPWIPRGLATYLSFNWKTREAFEYSSTLVDDLMEVEGGFDDVIRSMKDDPNGAQVDARKEFIDFLDERCTMITDNVLPITPQSERVVYAIKLTNPMIVARTVEKTMKTDPGAMKRMIGDHVVWEIVDKPDEDLPGLELEGPGFDPLKLGGKEKDPEEKKGLPSSAVTVAYGHLLMATHFDFLKTILAPRDARETLAGSADYRILMDELDEQFGDVRSVRYFARTDQSYRSTYELIKAGKMPEAETLFGKALNQVFSTGEEGELRQQKVDGKNLPPYEMARRYFGPTGATIKSEEQGWFMLGILLSKEMAEPEVAEKPDPAVARP